MLKLTHIFVSIATICLISLLTVTVHAADIGVNSICSLADAISAANSDAASGGCPAGSGADTITLTRDVTLTAALPEIESEISIEGNGYTISGNEQHQIFWVDETGALTIQHATLADGRGADDDDLYDEDLLIGGAIINFGIVHVSDGEFTRNSAEWGGAIFSAVNSSVSIRDSAFTGNSAEKGAAILADDQAIVSIHNSSFTGNITDWTGNAIYIDYEAKLNINDSVLTDNLGNVISNRGEINLRDSTFSGNSNGAISNSGQASIGDSTFSDNSSDNHAGAIYNGGDMSVSNSNFLSNRARRNGGAIYSDGQTNISDCNFTNNAATQGGAIYDRDGASISGSSFAGNSAIEDGGAIYTEYSYRYDLIIDGSLFTGNAAGDEGGAIRGKEKSDVSISQSIFRDNSAEDGGAIYTWGELKVSRSTFTNNSAIEEGGAIANHGEASIQDSILVDNPGGDCHLGRRSKLLESGNNHISDASCGATWSGSVSDGYCPPGQERDGVCQIGAPSSADASM